VGDPRHSEEHLEAFPPATRDPPEGEELMPPAEPNSKNESLDRKPCWKPASGQPARRIPCDGDSLLLLLLASRTTRTRLAGALELCSPPPGSCSHAPVSEEAPLAGPLRSRLHWLGRSRSSESVIAACGVQPRRAARAEAADLDRTRNLVSLALLPAGSQPPKRTGFRSPPLQPEGSRGRPSGSRGSVRSRSRTREAFAFVK
jgi:hypothetical protein